MGRHPRSFPGPRRQAARGRGRRSSAGGGAVQLWDRGYWIAQGEQPPEQALKSGEVKFTLQGERLHGSWVLVRMKNDRYGGSGKRTNWLLIKHRDEYARKGDHDELLAADRSVASGRPMAQIDAGKGPAPKPFMLAKKGGRAAKANAVWHSNRSDSSDEPTQVTDMSASGDAAPKAVGKRMRGRLPASQRRRVGS